MCLTWSTRPIEVQSPPTSPAQPLVLGIAVTLRVVHLVLPTTGPLYVLFPPLEMLYAGPNPT